MQPGDKVRFLNENLEGIITRIIDPKTFGVEISDGFEIPVLKNEIVVIESNNLSNDVELKVEDKKSVKFSDPGLFVLIEQHVGSYYNLKILNHFDSEIIFAVYREKDQKFSLVTKGQLLEGKALPVEQLDLTMPEKWPVFHFCIIPLMNHSSVLPLVSQYKFIYRSKDFIHYTDENGRRRYSIKLLSKSKEQQEVNIEELVKSFDEPKTSENPVIQMDLPQIEIDLHIEKLVSNSQNISADEALSIQIKTFENNFEKAISMGHAQITFIHGVGNGTLKYHIRKYLSQSKQIKSFRDAQKERFGFGATEVFLK